MKHLYLFTLEVAPLEVSKTYDELPSHLTLVSRFWSDLPSDELADAVRQVFAQTGPVDLIFGETVELGPKKLTVHLVEQPQEQALHNKLCTLLDSLQVEYQYPMFIREGHKPHVTKREGVEFAPGRIQASRAAYLIEVVDEKRVIRSKFEL